MDLRYLMSGVALAVALIFAVQTYALVPSLVSSPIKL